MWKLSKIINYLLRCPKLIPSIGAFAYWTPPRSLKVSRSPKVIALTILSVSIKSARLNLVLQTD